MRRGKVKIQLRRVGQRHRGEGLPGVPWVKLVDASRVSKSPRLRRTAQTQNAGRPEQMVVEPFKLLTFGSGFWFRNE